MNLFRLNENLEISLDHIVSIKVGFEDSIARPSSFLYSKINSWDRSAQDISDKEKQYALLKAQYDADLEHYHKNNVKVKKYYIGMVDGKTHISKTHPFHNKETLCL